MSASGPVIMAGAVAVSATTGTMALAASPSVGSEADFAGTTSEDLLAQVLGSRVDDPRASRDDDRGLLGNLLGGLLGDAESESESKSDTRSKSKAEAKSKAKSSSKSKSKSDSKSKSKSTSKGKSDRAKAKAAKRAKMLPSFVKPMKNYRLTARFGQSGSRWSRHHTGLDFAAPYGSPIRAVAAGTVVSAGWAGAYGYRTIIRHADGTRTWYAHQSRMIVRHGKVKAGQIIGRVGSTGNSTGPHMHLEVRKHGQPMNPYTWLRARGVRV